MVNFFFYIPALATGYMSYTLTDAREFTIKRGTFAGLFIVILAVAHVRLRDTRRDCSEFEAHLHMDLSRESALVRYPTWGFFSNAHSSCRLSPGLLYARSVATKTDPFGSATLRL